jgi:hypothetical protein
MKLIVSKYATRCGGCQKVIPAGSRCYWAKGFKPMHEGCFNSGAKPTPSPVSNTAPKAKGNKSPYDPDFVIDWAELRPVIALATSKFGGAVEKPKDWKGEGNWRRFCNEYPKGGDATDNFKFFTSGQMNRWVTKGYETDAIRGLAGLPPIREKRRTIYVEDGDELQVDRALNGEDNFMSVDTKREVIPGVRLNIELDASADSSIMLRDYQRWIAQTIYALETSGVDCEVNIFTLSGGLFQGQSKTCRQTVRVKKFGVTADFAGFSAMFSPGAFRGIMFSLFSMHADRQGWVWRSYGHGVTSAWGVRFNPAENSIDVACNWTATTFPAEMMTNALNQAIRDMKAPR